MLKKEFTPEIVGIVEKFNWLVELSKSSCPDKLIKTAIAIANHIHQVCKIGKCIKVYGETCADFGWAFPDQSRDVGEINGNNESSTSKKINELVQQGWLVKVVERRYGARVKNLFALSYGSAWKAPTKSITDHLEGKGGKPKKEKIALAIVKVDNPRLSNSTSGDCQSRQPAIVSLDKVNSNNKHKLKTVTGNSNGTSAPGKDIQLKIKIISSNLLDLEGRKMFGASREATSKPLSSLTLDDIFFLDSERLTPLDETISNHAVVKTDNRKNEVWTW